VSEGGWVTIMMLYVIFLIDCDAAAQPEANNRFGIQGVRSIIITSVAVAATAAALITDARNLRRVRN